MRKDILIPYFTVIALVLISTLILWFPFLIRAPKWFGLSIPDSNFQYIYRNFDGPLYIIPAKFFYDIKQIDAPGRWLIIPFPVGPKYFAAHLPLYPLFINLLATITGYLKSMVLVNLIFTTLLALFFYYFLKIFKLSKKPLILTSVFLFLPRFLVVRSIGAPESLFMLMILLSLYFFEKEKYLLAGIFGGLATMTKTPGVLLLGTYLLVFIERYLKSFVISNEVRNLVPIKSERKKDASLDFSVASLPRNDIKSARFNWQYLFILIIPTGLLLVFIFYYFQLGDFFAYFHSGDNIHLVAPFAVFNSQSRWVGTAWLEDIIFYFFLYLLTVISLKNSKYRSFFYFSLVFFIATIFVQHRDIDRYSLPLWPMACIALEKFFTSKKFLIALIILLPAIYMYAWNFLLSNLMPISDWAPFL